MKLSEEDLRGLWREQTADMPTDRPACLTDTELARLLSNEADTTERMRAANHIASCAACAEEYRLLQPLQSWVADAERVLLPHDSAGERWSGWRGWFSSPRLGFAMAAATVLLVSQGVMLSLLVGSWRDKTQLETQLAENTSALSATQASLTDLQEKLGTQTATGAQLQQRIAQLSAPQLDVALAELEPQYSGVLRGAADPEIVAMAPDAPTVTLILNLPPLARRATLEVEVADEGGRVRWTGRTQRDRETATLTLSLPGAGYPPGEYVVRLFDVTRGRAPLATYPIMIRHTLERNR